MSNSAVLLIIFNRPNTTKQVFDAIRTSKPEKLYIAADGHRHGVLSDLENCKISRAITELIDWPCEVKRLYQEQNLGCSFGPRTAFDWFFSYESEGIILEDDCVPHPDFFQFASEMLDRYRHNKKIISINGSNLGYRLENSNSYTFSRFMNMWGWATWADRANSIDYSISYWNKVRNPLLFLYTKLRQNIFDTDINWYKYWQHKFDLTAGQENISWWDWQWIFHQVINEQLSIVPSVNLVTNIGFNSDATHTQEENNPASNIQLAQMKFPLLHPKNIKPDLVYEEKFVKWVWCYHKRLPLIFYIKQFISNLLRK